MAFVFDSEAKSPTANSYVSVAEANDFFDGDLDHALWSKKSTPDRQRLLVAATNRLEAEMWGGQKTHSLGRLMFPRRYLITREAYAVQNAPIRFVDDTSGSIYFYNPDTIPEFLKIATYKLAMYFLKKNDPDYEPTVSEEDQEIVKDIAYADALKINVRDGLTVERLPTPVRRILSSAGPGVWLGASTAQTTLARG